MEPTSERTQEEMFCGDPGCLWPSEHPGRLGSGLTDEDLAALSAGCHRVRNLMLDGHWHTAVEIRHIAEGSEGLRRLRELRPHYTIEKRRIAKQHRHYEYRLKVDDVF